MHPLGPYEVGELRSMATSVILWTGCLALLIHLLPKLFNWFRIYWHLRKLPSPSERFPFSFVLDMRNEMAAMEPGLTIPTKMYQYFKKKFYDYIEFDIMVCFFGPQPFVIPCSPDAIQPFLSHKENLNKSFLYDMMRPWLGNGLLTSEKSTWKVRRKLLNPAFHSRVVVDYTPTMNRHAAEMVAKLESLEDKNVDILPVMRRTAFVILFETAMGIYLNEEEIAKHGFLEVNDKMAASIVSRMINPLEWPSLIYTFSAEGKAFYKNVDFVKQYTRNVIKTRKQTYKAGLEDNFKRSSFMDIILRMHIEEGMFTEDEIREEVNTFMIGGFDTTAKAAAFAVHLLGNHPEVQAKVHKELDIVFGSDRERPVTDEDMKQLTYLECVIKEALRLYPPIPVIARDIDQDVKTAGYLIPRGSVAVIPLIFLQRHPRYFDRPEDFVPERFMEAQERHPFAYVPFSAGPRNCIGFKFAQLEDKILLAHIMRSFKVVSKIPMEDVQLSLELTLRPANGLEVTLIPRAAQ
ncbi:cytochrome P450 4V2 [Ixodes scapularis]|uniref:cytochrome P450 4V2 n=1 Tax=Ixodes scapularis TaxID=6945 RepID=UPI001A9FECA0|nr:cytochrome P450 4V2 [Ixodes scapularis]